MSPSVIEYMSTRNPQTAAELGFVPVDGPSLLVWAVWLLYAATER